MDALVASAEIGAFPDGMIYWRREDNRTIKTELELLV